MVVVWELPFFHLASKKLGKAQVIILIFWRWFLKKLSDYIYFYMYGDYLPGNWEEKNTGAPS